MSDRVRVRFAPSPTGPLHIGGVKTALLNYLYAKKRRGDFILRIEDTDQSRFVPGAEKYILNSLKWLGINHNEGVGVKHKKGHCKSYRQSKRHCYEKYAMELVKKGYAYYAFETPEELDKIRLEFELNNKKFSYDYHTRTTIKELKNSLNLDKNETSERIKSDKPYVIRFKMPENKKIKVKDIIRGTIYFNTSSLDDKIIFKSDGMPTYHLANVVDDHLMKITHVIRGEEWLPSLPLHIMLYEAFGWHQPEFAHQSLILKPSGQGKLSKRDGDKFGFPVFPLEWKSPSGEVSAGYREAGYFPEAVVNILAMLGWNPGTEQEIFTMEELIQAISLERVTKAGARFDPEKAKWFNQQHLQRKSDKELAVLFNDILVNKGINKEPDFIEKVVGLIKERASFVSDFWGLSSYFFIAPESFDEKARKKFWKEDTTQIITECRKILENTNPFTSTELEERIKTWIGSKEIGFGKVMNPLRLAIVGAAMGPHLFDILEMIGKEETLKRIKGALDKL